MCFLQPPNYPKRDKKEPLLYWMDVQADLTSTVAHFVEGSLCNQEIADSILGRVITKTLEMILAALSLGAQH